MQCKLILAVVMVSAGTADAASYRKTDGTIVDPIKYGYLMDYADHPYAGDDLQPAAALSGVDLSYATLDSADLQNSDLSYANLYMVDFYTANLSGAMLFGANLDTARLFGADVSGANLEGANLSNAQLVYTDFSGANLTNADLRYAEIYNVLLTGANLSGIQLEGEGSAVWGDGTDWSGTYYYANNPPKWGTETDAAWGADQGITVLDPVVSVPEPATLIMLLLGLFLSPMRRRKVR